MISQVLYISHLLFVDNILIFCDGSFKDTDKLVEFLDMFSCATGMQINEIKSSLPSYNMNEAEIHYYQSLFAFP